MTAADRGDEVRPRLVDVGRPRSAGTRLPTAGGGGAPTATRSLPAWFTRIGRW